MEREKNLRRRGWRGMACCSGRPITRPVYIYVSEYACLFVCVNCVVAGTLTCCRVAKVSVSPRALQALREQTQAFGQETRESLLKEACRQGNEGRLDVHQECQVFPLVGLVETSAHLSPH